MLDHDASWLLCAQKSCGCPQTAVTPFPYVGSARDGSRNTLVCVIPCNVGMAGPFQRWGNGSSGEVGRIGEPRAGRLQLLDPESTEGRAMRLFPCTFPTGLESTGEPLITCLVYSLDQCHEGKARCGRMALSGGSRVGPVGAMASNYGGPPRVTSADMSRGSERPSEGRDSEAHGNLLTMPSSLLVLSNS